MSRKTFAYVSSWSHGEKSSGLSLYSYDEETGAFGFIKQIDDRTEFAVSTIDRKRNILYILDESGDLPGVRVGGGGRLFAFQIDPKSGDLEQISCVPTWCPNPSYVSMDKEGKYLVVSNHAGRSTVTKLVRDGLGKMRGCVVYDDSVVDLFEIHADGSVGELVDAAKHEGSGPDPKFQTNPHPHCAVMSPCGTFFTVCDKGNDGVYMYRIDRKKDRLVLAGAPYACEPGSRPRFAAYHPTKPYLYHNNEAGAKISAYRYDERGNLERIGAYDVRTEEKRSIEGKWEQQDFRMDSRGRYLYSLTVAPAGVTVCEVNQEDGSLKTIQNLPLGDDRPRACALSPDGRFLAVACLNSGRLVTLKIGEDGTLTETGLVAKHDSAAFITFYQP